MGQGLDLKRPQDIPFLQFRENIILILGDHGNCGFLVHCVEQLPPIPRCAENVGVARREVLLDLIVLLIFLACIRLRVILFAGILFGGLTVILRNQGGFCIYPVMAEFPAILPGERFQGVGFLTVLDFNGSSAIDSVCEPLYALRVAAKPQSGKSRRRLGVPHHGVGVAEKADLVFGVVVGDLHQFACAHSCSVSFLCLGHKKIRSHPKTGITAVFVRGRFGI